MARSRHNSKAKRAADLATLAQTLAPEDIRPGDYVALLHEIYEVPSFYWCRDAALDDRSQMVRLSYIPHEDSAPLKVRAVCLPFVLVRQFCGLERTIDTRRCRLARLHAGYAATAWKAYRKAAKKRRCGDVASNVGV